METSDASRDRAAAAGAPSGVASGDGPRAHSVGFLLSQLGWATAMRFREILAPLDLEPRQFATLRALAAAEGQSQQAICSALSIPPSRMVGLVDVLEERGLVERRSNAADRRARAIYVTAEGRELLETATAQAMAHERWICEPLSPGEREHLLAVLGRLADHYELPIEVHPDLTTKRAQPWPGASE
jgi:DNA-binding MarR family transcriptional regulator